MLNHTTMQTLRALLSDRAEVLSQMAALKAEVAQIEARISELVATQDGPIKVPGFGSLCITAPSVARSFDPDALRELIQSLRETGQGEIADEIATCTKESLRAADYASHPRKAETHDYYSTHPVRPECTTTQPRRAPYARVADR
jgi:hypothetical protein